MSQRLRLFRAALISLGTTALLACQSQAPTPSTGSAGPSGPEAFRPASSDDGAPGNGQANANPEAAATHVIRTSATRNEDGTLALIAQVEPRGDYHLNAEPSFPWRASIADDAPIAAGTTLRSADAAELTEQRVTFRIDAPDAPGVAQIDGSLVIGVCDSAGCTRVEEEVMWDLPTP